MSTSTAQHFRGSEALSLDTKLYLIHLVIALRHLEASASWGVFGASWRLLAAPWAVLGPSLEPLGPSWGVLPTFWCVFAPSWEPLGASWGILAAS